MDPIAELLSQLSGVRRATNLGTSHSQLQQLQMQLQLERHSASGSSGMPALSSRQPFGSDRAPIERVIRRHQQSGQSHSAAGGLMSSGQQAPYVVLMEPSPSSLASTAAAAAGQMNGLSGNGVMMGGQGSHNQPAVSRLLLSRCNDQNYSESEHQDIEKGKADKSLFVQELLLTTLTGNLSLVADEDVAPYQPDDQVRLPSAFRTSLLYNDSHDESSVAEFRNPFSNGQNRQPEESNGQEERGQEASTPLRTEEDTNLKRKVVNTTKLIVGN
jgi:hypothetical protein